jgi:hypothetical protein
MVYSDGHDQAWLPALQTEIGMSSVPEYSEIKRPRPNEKA